MYEGKNIHFSPVDQRLLCSCSGKICRQRRLNGYAFCLRHILEDPTAPYKRCINIAKNGQQCSNVIPQSRKADLCNSHVHAQANNQAKLQAAAAAAALNQAQQFGTLPKTSTPLVNGSECGPAGLYAMSASFNNNLQLASATAKTVVSSSTASAAKPEGGVAMSSGLDDPYAFPSDPEPPRAAKPPVGYGAVTQPFPNLSMALANLAAGKVGQPQVYDGSSSSSSSKPETGCVSSIARLYPELADKLDIGKKSPKNEQSKGKNACTSSPSNSKSSRTMNRLQTKIAQNKIKDKLKKNSASSPTNSLGSTKSVGASQVNSDIFGPVPIAPDLDSLKASIQDDNLVNNILPQMNSNKKKTTSGSNKTESSSSSVKSKSKSKSRSAKKSNSTSTATAPTETLPRTVGHFPMLESQLQTNPLVTPWQAAGFPMPSSSADATISDARQILPAGMGPTLPFIAPGLTPEQCFLSAANQLELAGRTLCKNMNMLNQAPNYPILPAPMMPPGLDISSGLAPVISSAAAASISSCSKSLETAHSTESVIKTESCTAASKPEPGKTKDDSTSEQDVKKPLPTPPPPPPAPAISCVRFRQCRVFEAKDICQKVKKRSSYQICCVKEKRKRRHIDLIPTGVDSSEDDASDYEEIVQCQKEWLISSSESEEDEDFLDDPLLANIRHTKLSLLHTKFRRHFVQSQKASTGNTCLTASRRRDLATLVKAARADSASAAEALKVVLKVPHVSGLSHHQSSRHATRPCLCKEGELPCDDTALPYTNHCKKHIMYNVDQQLYDYCTAKFSDNTQCCVSVFDIRHELPLCPEHAAKADNYQKNLELSRPKKPRKKTKPSALTRPPKKGKKKKNQRKNNRAEKSAGASAMAESGDDLSKQDLDVQGPGDFPEAPLSPPPPHLCVSPPHLCVSSPDDSLHDIDPVDDDDLGNDLEESFSPGTIDKHLELPLGEQDLNEVLNKLPEEALNFELFSGKNGEFVNSRVEEEAAAFEHVLAETSKKMKASEVLNRMSQDPCTRTSTSNMSMLLGDHHSNLHGLEEPGPNDDEITKEIADSILQQDLSPTGSIVDDLGQDNISALASSLSVTDLRNISQVLNATLINNPTVTATQQQATPDLYTSNTSLNLQAQQIIPSATVSSSSTTNGAVAQQIHGQIHHQGAGSFTYIHNPSTSTNIAAPAAATANSQSHFTIAGGQIAPANPTSLTQGSVLRASGDPSLQLGHTHPHFIANQIPGAQTVISNNHAPLVTATNNAPVMVTNNQAYATNQVASNHMVTNQILSVAAGSSTNHMQMEAPPLTEALVAGTTHVMNRNPVNILQRPQLVAAGSHTLGALPQSITQQQLQQPQQGVNGSTSSVQSIAQILAALTAGTKQFTNNQEPNAQPQTFPQVVTVNDTSIQQQIQQQHQVTLGQSPVMAASTTPLVATNTSVHHTNSIPYSAAASFVNSSHKNLIPQPSLQNGLLTLPTGVSAQQLAALPVGNPGLKLACPLQTLVPVGLLNSALTQGMTPVAPNHGQPLVAKTNTSQVVPIATAQATGSGTGLP